MRIKRKSEFDDLKTAVFYDFEYFIPDSEYELDPKLIPNKTKEQIISMNNFLKNRIKNSVGFYNSIRSDVESGKFRAKRRLIQGSKKRFDGIDFAEYDFNVILEDQKFNNKDLISYLDKETMSSVGTSLGSLEKINSTLFPTLSNSDAQANDTEYFGTLSLSAITLYLFNLDPKMYKIELYEDIIEENNSSFGGFIESDVLDGLGIDHVSPAVTIYLGPNQECINNMPSIYGSDSMFALTDPLKNNRSNYYEYEPLEYSKLYDEIYAGKSVWLALSPDKTIKEINLSYRSWLQSEDANIYKNRFNLRNDDYYDRTNSHYINEDRGVFIDKRSGKLLGNKTMVINKEQPERSSCPLLSRKLRLLEEKFGNSETKNYSPEIEYKPGSLVVHNGEVYKALKSGNRGHFPDISSCWALNNKVNDVFTTRVTIINLPQSAGTSTPGCQITIVDDKRVPDMNFRIAPNLGYKFNSVLVEDNSGELAQLSPPDDYTVSSVTDGDSYYNLVTIKNHGWEEILGVDSRKRIIFEYITSRITTSIKYNLNDNDIITTGTIEIHGFSDGPLSPSSENYYKIILGAIIKNGVRYDTASSMTNILDRNLSIGDNIEFEFALVDYKHNNTSRFTKASLVKMANGKVNILSPDLQVTYIPWSYISGRELIVPILHVPFNVDFENMDVTISSETKMNVTVSEYSGFEVDKINAKTNYNELFSLHFYGTYGDKFQKLSIYDNTIITVNDVGKNIPIRVNNIPVTLKLTKSGTMYTLDIDKVVKDTDIKLYEK